jgi:hypothetical protein
LRKVASETFDNVKIESFPDPRKFLKANKDRISTELSIETYN